MTRARTTPTKALARLGTLIFSVILLVPLVVSAGHAAAGTTVTEAESFTLAAGSGAVVTDATASAGRALLVWSNGTATGHSSISSAATTFTVRAMGDQCQGAPVVSVSVDGVSLGNRTVSATTWTSYSFSGAWATGSHSVGLSYANDYAGGNCDRNLRLDDVSFTTVAPPVVPPPVGPNVTQAESFARPGFGAVAADVNASAGHYLMVWSNGTASGPAPLTASATTFTVRALGNQCQGAPVVKVTVDGVVLGNLTVSATTWTSYAFAGHWAAGTHTVALSYVNDFVGNGCDRNLRLDSVSFTGTSVAAAQTNASVDFGSVGRTVSPYAAGIVFAGFGGGAWPGTTNAYATAQGQALKSLDARYVRMGGRWNASMGQIVSASSGSTVTSVEQPIKWFYDNGFHILFGFAGETGDFAGYNPANIGNIIRRIKALGMTDLSRFDFQGPNEPDQAGATDQQIIDRTIALYNDIQGEAPGKKIWGPVRSSPNSDMAAYIAGVGINRLAGIDWHSYPGGAGLGQRDIPTTWGLVSPGGNDYNEVGKIRNLLGAHYPSVGIAVDEINWSQFHSGSDAAVFTSANTVFMALTFAGMISEGGRPMAYSDLNGDLSVMVDSYQNPDNRPRSSPMPAYWGIGALIGAGMPGQPALFPHFKDTVYNTSSTQDDTKIFAFNNEDPSNRGKNIILVNRRQSATQTVNVQVTGANAGVYYLFQGSKAAPYAAPVRTGPFAFTPGTAIAVSMDAQTVATIQLSPAS